MNNDNLKAVVYTDGSADNMTKIYGYGVHGYIFDKTDESNKTNNKPATYLVTDIGYLEPNESKIKPHKIVNPLYYVDMYGTSNESGTNNIAEVSAILEIIKIFINNSIKDILVHTDSTYAMHVINNTRTMSIEDITRTVDVNQTLWFKAKEVHEVLNEKEIILTIDKIKAHSGHLGNEISDDLALLGRVETMRTNIQEVIYRESEAKTYWKSKYERHPFLNTKQIFFNPVEQVNNTTSMDYYILNYKLEHEIGKRLHTALYGYVVLKEKDPYIELAKEVFIDKLNGHSVPSTIRMDNLFKHDTLRLIDMYDKKPMVLDNRNKRNLTILENDVIANAINPPALAYKAFDDMVHLKMIKDDYLTIKNKPEHKTFREYIDITDMFYTKDVKNKTIIRPEIINDTIVSNYEYSKDGKTGKIVIKLGADIITRNQLKKIEKLEPKIYLVVMNNNNITLNYFTIIDLENTGDISVWANYYCNTVLMK